MSNRLRHRINQALNQARADSTYSGDSQRDTLRIRKKGDCEDFCGYVFWLVIGEPLKLWAYIRIVLGRFWHNDEVIRLYRVETQLGEGHMIAMIGDFAFDNSCDECMTFGELMNSRRYRNARRLTFGNRVFKIFIGDKL